MTVITVDDQDPSIIYAPTLSSWGIIDGPGVDAGGTHMMSNDPNATAMLTGRFLNAHFWSPRWPYLVTTDISIDGRIFTVNLQDPNAPEQPSGGGATVASSVAFSYFGTTTQEHMIVLSVHPGDLYVVLDQFTFDVEDNPVANITTSSPIPGSTAAPSSESSTISSAPLEATNTPQSSGATSTNLGNALKRKPATVPIIIGVIVVAFVLFLVGLIVFIVCRRRRKPKPERFLYESPFDWRSKRQAPQGSFTSDRSDANWIQSPLMRQANIPSSPAPTYFTNRSYEGATGAGDNVCTTAQADSSLHKARKTRAPANALRVMNNARSRHYPSGVTLLTPLSEEPMPMPIPLHAAVNASSGYEGKASLVANANGSACRQLYGDSKKPDSKDGQWSTKKSREHQSGLYSPAPPSYQTLETMIYSEKHPE
ncbi:hypothetical protein BJ912DRAFT_1058064 [Pholiota molesta]|nr:hypothetical protein BJ912DRAFT_1058064 [Pholiota molesta]